MEIIENADTADIVSVEYFFDKDKGYGEATAITFGNPLPNGKFTFKIPFGNIPTGADTVFFRVQDGDKKVVSYKA